MYAIVDIETTGGYASANSITEIAIYVHDGNRIVKHFESLVNPLQPVPKHITALTGIDDEMLKDAPTFAEIAATVFDLLTDNIFVAHSVNFDYSFVNHQLRSNGLTLSPKKLCTVRLSKKVVPGFSSYSLGNLCRSLQIPISNRHRAGGDAKATVLLLEHLLKNGAQPHIDQMLKKTSSEQWLPLHLKKEDISTLPATPGVYYFHNSKDKIIYVGKAINIKKRVSSHFTINDSGNKRQHFVRDIHKITYRQCATELEAIVLESTEIRRLWPKHNKSQKQPLQKYALYMFEDNRGYMRLAIDKKKKNLTALYHFNLLHEGQSMLRKMSEEFELDKRLCFLDRTPLSQNENYESLIIHNKKIHKALSAMNEQLPSFAVVDNGIEDGKKLCLLIEKGSFWGMGHIPANTEINSAEELKEILTPYADNDTIRNSIFAFAELNPDKMVRLKITDLKNHISLSK